MEEKYRACHARGRPVHIQDRFSKEHPAMDPQRRAKLFMPFDALDGYSDAIAERQKITAPPPELSMDEKEELDRNLLLLAEKCRAGEHIMVTVVFFRPDPGAETGSSAGSGVRGALPKPGNSAGGVRGVFRETDGMLTKIDPDRRYLQVVEMKIDFDAIYRLSSASLPDTACGP